MGSSPGSSGSTASSATGSRTASDARSSRATRRSGTSRQAYGLEQVALTGLSPEAEPSPRRLEALVERIRRERATTVFFETLVSPKLAETVAREAGARTAVLDPLEGLSDEDAARGDDYFA